MATALLIGLASQRRAVKEDTAIGVVFTGMFALGVLLMSRTRSYRDLTHMLFGNVLGVTTMDLWFIAGVSVVVLLTLALFHKELELTAFDPTHARMIGLRTDWIRLLLLGLLALAAVAGIQTVGVILTNALLITPAATAAFLSDRMPWRMLLGAVLATVCSIVGLTLSYVAETRRARPSSWPAPPRSSSFMQLVRRGGCVRLPVCLGRTMHRARWPRRKRCPDAAENRASALAQLVCCQGCCCGRTDRGRPELPVEQFKEIWRTEKLNRTVQLTISGCLGPCDLANVALIMLPEGNIWLGDMAGPEVYERLVAWARSCHAEGQVLPLPEELDSLRFEMFQTEEVAP